MPRAPRIRRSRKAEIPPFAELAAHNKAKPEKPPAQNRAGIRNRKAENPAVAENRVYVRQRRAWEQKETLSEILRARAEPRFNKEPRSQLSAARKRRAETLPAVKRKSLKFTRIARRRPMRRSPVLP